MDNQSGTSGVAARLDLLEKCVKIIGKNRMLCMIGDREFIGKDWISYLVREKIGFCLRVPQHHKILLQNGVTTAVADLLVRANIRFFQGVIVDATKCNVLVKKVKNDSLFLISNEFSKNLDSIYSLRWSIETLFQSCKQRGFNLEDTHLKSSEKIKNYLCLYF